MSYADHTASVSQTSCLTKLPRVLIKFGFPGTIPDQINPDLRRERPSWIQPVFHFSCTLKSPGDLLIILMPRPIKVQLNQNLWGWDPGIHIFNNSPSDSKCSQGWEQLLCSLTGSTPGTVDTFIRSSKRFSITQLSGFPHINLRALTWNSKMHLKSCFYHVLNLIPVGKCACTAETRI